MLLLAAAACGHGTERGTDSRDAENALVVFTAGSLARPIRVALDSFARREGIRLDQESAGSLESARKITELRRIPDVIALADEEIFARILMPAHVSWYARFARNRIVLAYSDRSLHAEELTQATWPAILTRNNVQVGRSDPNLDPAGYRTLLVFQLAERFHADPGLASRLLAAAPARNVRPKEVELTGLLQAGELDYIWTYESVAQAAGLRYLRLPAAIDLGSPADSVLYSSASVRVSGRTPDDTLLLVGEPIVYGLSVPDSAPHPGVARRAAAFLLSSEGARLMRSASLDVIELAGLVGEVPAFLEHRDSGGPPRAGSTGDSADAGAPPRTGGAGSGPQ